VKGENKAPKKKTSSEDEVNLRNAREKSNTRTPKPHLSYKEINPQVNGLLQSLTPPPPPLLPLPPLCRLYHDASGSTGPSCGGGLIMRSSPAVVSAWNWVSCTAGSFAPAVVRGCMGTGGSEWPELLSELTVEVVFARVTWICGRRGATGDTGR